jgi:hypothetical protein
VSTVPVRSTYPSSGRGGRWRRGLRLAGETARAGGTAGDEDGRRSPWSTCPVADGGVRRARQSGRPRRDVVGFVDDEDAVHLSFVSAASFRRTSGRPSRTRGEVAGDRAQQRPSRRRRTPVPRSGRRCRPSTEAHAVNAGLLLEEGDGDYRERLVDEPSRSSWLPPAARAISRSGGWSRGANGRSGERIAPRA